MNSFDELHSVIVFEISSFFVFSLTRPLSLSPIRITKKCSKGHSGRRVMRVDGGTVIQQNVKRIYVFYCLVGKSVVEDRNSFD